VIERRAAMIRGIVQGVGFRPFVHRLATQLALGGFVRNESGAVRVELEGSRESLDAFDRALYRQAPPLARIEQIAWEPIPRRGEQHFWIEPSGGAACDDVFISRDVATCDECLAELFDPCDRRYRYPFLNCTQCGPRLTIIEGAPYDRERTTMARFAMCAYCRAEFEDPGDRRFHAQPIACPACGPRLKLVDASGTDMAAADPLADFVARILEGRIGALKGLGGYHLVCDATAEATVRELRHRKGRDEKPLALMVADVEQAELIADINAAERELLLSAKRPIVLLTRRASQLAPSVAPGNPRLGIMLPYTPLHHLLLREASGIPLVMTSGNRSDEPIAYEDSDAIGRLGGIADAILTHDRPIRVRCDDSVTQVIAGRESPVRRSRGYAPQPITLPIACPQPMLAVGGQLKATFSLGRNRTAFLSHHLGDLDHWPAYEVMVRDVQLYEDLFRVCPRVVVHDMHPDYASTQYARQRAVEQGLSTFAVQHHHAHVAACLAEHKLTGPVIGVAFDGTGLGTDGGIWGGEFLVADLRGFRRVAHLRYVALPGGDQAIREPWRSAAAHLTDAGCDLEALSPSVEHRQLKMVQQMIERPFNCPRTSSVGRLFDAVAAIAGMRTSVSYEGQAAMELEWLAARCNDATEYPLEIIADQTDQSAPLIIDTRQLIRAVVADVQRGLAKESIARRFHNTLATMIGGVCEEIRRHTSLTAVALSGGVFMNVLLTEQTIVQLQAAGFEVLYHRLVPANDGGLGLGQLAIAAASLSSDGSQIPGQKAPEAAP
jgi:hydrogenase maturation protein HypF